MKVCVLGRYGMVGSAIHRVFKTKGCETVGGPPRAMLDLEDEHDTDGFIRYTKPDVVILAAAKVGGIYANKTYPAQFIHSNIRIQTNVIHACYRHKVPRLIFLGSSCIYPKFAEQPILESALLSGEMEPTNKAYAVAKIAGVIMCQSYNKEYGTNYTTVMPTNMYGPNDNYDPMDSHVLPGLIHKFHLAKVRQDPEITLWGSGTPLREFLYSTDLANAVWTILQQEDPVPDLINVGSGEEVSIKELATMIAQTVGYEGTIKWDQTMPDGTPRKVLDSSIMRAMEWVPTVALSAGLGLAYRDYRVNERWNEQEG